MYAPAREGTSMIAAVIRPDHCAGHRAGQGHRFKAGQNLWWKGWFGVASEIPGSFRNLRGAAAATFRP